MTIKQKQCLLCYLGYYTGAIDGIWGTKSQHAVKAFQKDFGLTADGICGTDTEKAMTHAVAYGMSTQVGDEAESGDFWDEIVYFAREEFKCRCGGKYCDGYPAEPQEGMVRLADRARKHFGAPATVVSGLRCEKHNANVGGVANSQHMYGEAVDLRIQGVSAGELLFFIQSQPGVRYAYAINDTNVHFDIPKGER